MPTTVSIGVIGGGLMGREVASTFARWCALTDQPVQPRLVAVADPNPNALAWFRKLPHTRLLTADHRELLADPGVDVVYAAVPHHLHESIYLDTLAAGKDLLAEKPFVDHVKRIDHWPRQDTLASILESERSNGGGPYNVLKDLAVMGAPFPLAAAGLIGADEAGDWIVEDCQAVGIDVAQLDRTGQAGTSFTDAMTVASDGRRTFFHYRGANALLQPEQFDFSRTRARVFYLGYLMLLDALDALPDNTTADAAPPAEPATGAARVLAAAGRHGLHTVVDLVSAPGAHFSASVRAALPWIDSLILDSGTGRQFDKRGRSATILK